MFLCESVCVCDGGVKDGVWVSVHVRANITVGGQHSNFFVTTGIVSIRYINNSINDLVLQINYCARM